MARNSSSSSIQTWSWDVFVSFRGKDTRTNFTDHLFAALYRRGIHTFRDDKKLKRGKDIWTELEKAIKMSRIGVIVFSKNYAASRWCLKELAMIMECKQNLQQIVLPVFYKVDPSHLRNQNGSLKKMFATHEKRFGKHKVASWRAALIKATNLSGWDLQNIGYRKEDFVFSSPVGDALYALSFILILAFTWNFESNFIEEIAEDISNKLNEMAQLTAVPYPVGIESRVLELNKLLSRGSSDVCVVGILGIGGIGKTTIARAIYSQLRREFPRSCFLENVRETSKRPNGLIILQKQILFDIHVKYNRKITRVDQGTAVLKNSAWYKRVFLVLDDVDHRDQLDKLAIRRDYFELGSIIIITTRDKSMLKWAKVKEDKIYMPPALDCHESIKLFNWHAFGKGHPNEDYVKFSKKVIFHAGGVPLALKVLGSNLSDRSKDEWERTLKKLEVTSHEDIQEKLKVSYCSLSDTQKELFLDLACFFVGMEKNYAFKLLTESNSFLESELGVLVQRCLVTIDCSNRLTMHDIIRDMGREVALRERNRLWNHKHVLDVLEHHKGGEEVEGIMADWPRYDLEVDAKSFANMHRLRVLQLNYARLKGNFQCPSKRLRYLEWYRFPMSSIPADLNMENLVALNMPYSRLTKLWTGTKILKKLKFLDVRHSYYLRRTPDFSGITNLEALILNNCTRLVELHQSVGCLTNLATLDLAGCNKLTELPLGICNLKSRVNFPGRTKLDMVPRFEFKSPFTLKYSSLLQFSEDPLPSCGFTGKLPQHYKMSRFGDKRKFDCKSKKKGYKRKGTATFLDASKRRRLSAREAAEQRWDESPYRVPDDEAVNGDVDDLSVASSPMQDLYSSGIPTMTFVSQTERLKSLEIEQMSWKAERQLLHHQLKTICEDAARASSQHTIQYAALERENFRLRMELARASRQFAPQLYMDLPRPQLSSESASSSSASTQSSISAID